MPTIQIADKPTLDLVKSDTTAILNKSNSTGTAITNLQTSVNNGFSGVNTNINSVKTTLGTVNSNVSSIKSDNAINFSSNSQVVRDTAYYLNEENIEYTIPKDSSTNISFIENYTTAELHDYASFSPAINVATHRGKTKYRVTPDLYYSDASQKTINWADTNLYMSCLSKPRADDDFIYYADTNYNAYSWAYDGGTIAITEKEYTTFARNGAVYIYMFDGFSWHYAEVTGLGTHFPNVISLTRNEKQLLLNIFPTNHNHILFLEARVNGSISSDVGRNRYFILYPIEKNGVPIKYEAIDCSAGTLVNQKYMPAVIFPSPVGKTTLDAPSGQYAWYAVTQTGLTEHSDDDRKKYPILLYGSTQFSVWGIQGLSKNMSKSWIKIKDINLPSTETRMSEYTQPHMFYNIGCHLTSEPWFFFGHSEKAVWIPNILYKLKATNTTVNLDKSILATSNQSDFFIPFFAVTLGSSASDSYKRAWLNDLSSTDSYNMHWPGQTNSSFASYVLGLTMFVNSKGQHIVITENGCIGLDDNGFFALQGDVVSYNNIRKELSSTSTLTAHVLKLEYSRYPKPYSTYIQNLSLLRDKFYILPQPSNYEERPKKNRTTLIGY